MDCSLPGSPIPGILQARTLEWVAISFSNAWKWKVKVKLLSRVRLSNPMDCSLPGSSIHGVFQARVLECGAIAFSDQQDPIYQIFSQEGLWIGLSVPSLWIPYICINIWYLFFWLTSLCIIGSRFIHFISTVGVIFDLQFLSILQLKMSKIHIFLKPSS